MNRKKSLLVVMALLLVLTSIVPVFAQRTQVTWFVGLGTGGQEEQIAAQNAVVEAFNASQDEIELLINIVPNESATDVLSTLIAAGTPPDIVGPVGVGGGNSFADQWADLQPLADAVNYDFSVFDPALVDLYRTADGELQGIPFAVFPSMTYFNRNLFDEAGLNYPPQEFGVDYVMPDGTEVPWDYNAIAELAAFLTVDANGNDATMDGFDPSNIVQFGMNFQWAQMRLIFTHMQPEDIYDPAANTITIPESWRQAAAWYQDGIWGRHFIPNAAYDGSELLNSGNAFSSGNIAMAITPLWYTCCLDNSVGNFEWDVAVVPRGLDGEYHVATDADTFRMTKGSANPEAAFTALSYLLDEAVPALTPFYGAFPARPDYQQTFFDNLENRYPFGANWQVVIDSLAYNNPGPMHHEAWHPNWRKGYDRLGAFNTLLTGETGGEIDLAAELDTLEADLNAIVNE